MKTLISILLFLSSFNSYSQTQDRFQGNRTWNTKKLSSATAHYKFEILDNTDTLIRLQNIVGDLGGFKNFTRFFLNNDSIPTITSAASDLLGIIDATTGQLKKILPSNLQFTSSTNVIGGVTMTLGSDAEGDMYYRSSGILTRLAAGADNTVVQYQSGVPTVGPVVVGGTYTATLTGVTNVESITFDAAHYYREGNMCIVYIKCRVNPTAPGSTQFGISLPFASALTTGGQVIGDGDCTSIPDQTITVDADAGNDRANAGFTASDTNEQSFYFSFSYQIL